jgi:putative glutamine amidotransferase
MVQFRTHDLRKRQKPQKEEPVAEKEPEPKAPIKTEEAPAPERPAEKSQRRGLLRRRPGQAQKPATVQEPEAPTPIAAKPPAPRPIQHRARKPAPTHRESQDVPRAPMPMKRAGPVIGITCSFMYRPVDPYHTQRYFFLNQPYVTAIHEAGGIPVILPVGLEARYPNKMIGMLDGLLLPGGGDIDPNTYGDYPNEKLGRVDPRKDRTEIDLFTLAFNQNMPILGICRGVQLLNIALDGTLYQDLVGQIRMSMNHYPEYPASEMCHKVDIEKGTRLHKILGESMIWVNSSHHQAIKLHGKGLVVNAKSPDGVTEGLEQPSKKWVIGVQWHPELYWRNDRLMTKLFKEFVEACK